jgi:hypothetical protein
MLEREGCAQPPAADRRRPIRWVVALALVLTGAAGLIISSRAAARLSPPQPGSPLVCVEFEFHVTDAATGQPIEGASIHLFDTPNQTGPEGNYAVASECFQEHESITYPDWTFTVSAPGYQETGALRLSTYTGEQGNETRKRIEIALTRNRERPE